MYSLNKYKTITKGLIPFMIIIDKDDHYTIIDCGFRKYKFYHYNLDKFLTDEIKNIYFIADEKMDIDNIISILLFNQYHADIWTWTRLDLDNEALNTRYGEIYKEFEAFSFYHYLTHELKIEKRCVYGSKLDDFVQVIDFSNNALIVIEPISLMDYIRNYKLPDLPLWFNYKFHSKIKNSLKLIKYLIKKDKE